MSYEEVTDGAAVRAELRRIVASPHFEDAGRLVRFLTFVVDQTLSGNGGQLKETVIGVEVFARPPGYDPKTDPIVRVQARRLRSKLETWYQDGGRSSPIRITLPKGGYEPRFEPPPPEQVPAGEIKARPARHPAVWLIAAAALLLLLAGAAALFTRSKPAPAAAPGSRLFTAYPGYQTSPAFSPDGLTLAFAWGGGSENGKPAIYIQSLNADTPRKLTDSSQEQRNPAWLPDGQHIGFLRDDGPNRFAVIVVAILSAGETRVAGIAGDPLAPPRIEWSRDGSKLYTNEPPSPGEPQQVVEIDIGSGSRRWIAVPSDPGRAAGRPGDDDVHLSPDGKWLAFRRRAASSVGDVWIAPVNGGEPRQVTRDQTGIAGLAWSRDGKSLIVSSQRQSGLVRLWRFPLSGAAPVCLTDAALSASLPAVNPRDGQIAFVSRFLNTNIWRIDLQGKDSPRMVVASNLLDSSPNYSPRGDRIAFRSNRTGSDEIWTADAAGRSPVRLTHFGAPVTGSPHWSPDGQYLAFDSRPDGSADIFLIPAGGGQSRKLTSDASNEVTPAFSADGAYLYFASDRNGSWQIWKQPLSGGAAWQVTTAGGFFPQESADGKWLYYTRLNGGAIYRVPVKGGAETAVLNTDGAGSWGGWAVSGRRVIYVTGGQLRSFDPETGATQVLSALTHPAVQWDGALAISPDGRYALVAEVERQGSEIHLQPDR